MYNKKKGDFKTWWNRLYGAPSRVRSDRGGGGICICGCILMFKKKDSKIFLFKVKIVQIA